MDISELVEQKTTDRFGRVIIDVSEGLWDDPRGGDNFLEAVKKVYPNAFGKKRHGRLQEVVIP